MKMQTAARLLEILSVPPEEAMTTQEIGIKWFKTMDPSRTNIRGNPTQLTGDELRCIQRYVEELRESSKDAPALIEKIEVRAPGTKRPIFKYFHKRSRIVQWLMTDEAALNILLTRQIQDRAFGQVIDTKKISDIAETVAGSSTTAQRVRERLRVVPDGIGRLPARIHKKTLQETFNAIQSDRQLRFTYTDSRGKASEHTVSPQGLVAKDGTIYLIATKGLGDKPMHALPLQRMTTAEVTNKKSQFRPDFDLDRYILESHQLSHRIRGEDEDIELSLRVAPEALFHFQERGLSVTQTIGAASRTDGWRMVEARIPYTVLLVPFLLSMGGWIEVIGPPQVRKELRSRQQAMISRYESDS